MAAVHAGQGEVVLVSGGNKGIGYEIVKGLAEKGCTVLLGARDPERGLAAAKSLAGSGKVQFLEFDVQSESSVQKAAAEVEKQYGHLDVLINNAGISSAPGKESGSLNHQDVAQIFDVNVFAIIRIINAFLPLLKAATAGRILNVSSEVGSFGMEEHFGFVRKAAMGYSASKTALNAIMLSYAMNLEGSGVTINNVCPGYCATDLNGHSGPRTPQQGAAIAIKMALSADSPNGGFFNDEGKLPW